MGHTYTKKLFVVYLKLKYDWSCCVLSGNPTCRPGCWVPSPHLCRSRCPQRLAKRQPWVQEASGHAGTCPTRSSRSRKGDLENQEQMITPDYHHPGLRAPQQIRLYLSFQQRPEWCCIMYQTNYESPGRALRSKFAGKTFFADVNLISRKLACALLSRPSSRASEMLRAAGRPALPAPSSHQRQHTRRAPTPSSRGAPLRCS